MGFEQLAELRDRLRAQAENAKPAEPEPVRQSTLKTPGPRAEKRGAADPAIEAIWRLQKIFPRAFPRSPAPKVPLKVGIYQDAAQHLEQLGVSSEQLKQAIATWCRGARYWSSLVENAVRVDLNGEPTGMVTPEQAQRANTRPSRRQQGHQQAKRSRSDSSAAESPVEEAPPMKALSEKLS
ncbi:ProQ/FinO family protein [Pseudomonas chlororaphis]|uniref:ProQ/FinO family protein n=1 Tax=Pseudomonas chlororaphis TaxID=587753 RepID=UPI0009B89814|nr:ProQ/FinO family protein [Pseudomonas chlororaphis]